MYFALGIVAKLWLRLATSWENQNEMHFLGKSTQLVLDEELSSIH